jgi:5'-3' exonuclease
VSLIRLLDVSGLFWPIWRKKEALGEPIGKAATETVQLLRERASAGGADHVVACCDTGRSFRWEIAEEYRATVPDFKGYKGHRPEKDPAMMAVLDRVIDEMEQDGVPILRAAGFEADDVIATVTRWAVEQGHAVEIHSEDKDLLQLALDADPDNAEAPAVVVVRRDGTRQTSDECVRRIGVPPSLVAPFLALAGDDSDGVVGVPGVAGTWAKRLLWGEYGDDKKWQPTRFRNFDEIVSAAIEDQATLEQNTREIDEARVCQRVHKGTKKGFNTEAIASGIGITQAEVERLRAMVPPARLPEAYRPDFPENVRKSLIANAAHFDIGMRLTRLRDDVPLDFEKVTAPRVPKPKAANDWAEQRARVAAASKRIEQENQEDMDITATPEQQPVSAPVPTPIVIDAPVSAPRAAAPVAAAVPIVPPANQSTTTALALAKPTTTRITRTFEMELEPRSYEEATVVAEHAAASRLFKDILDPPQAMMLIMLGRKFGLSAVDSLRMIHMIEGKPSMSAQLIVGIVQKSGMAEYFELDESSNASAKWITKRHGNRKEKSWTFTIDDAKTARLGGIWDKEKKTLKEAFDPNSNWAKFPAVMCSWRAAVFLARVVYADLVGGLYMPDEIGGPEGVIEIDGNPPVLGVVGSVAA